MENKRKIRHKKTIRERREIGRGEREGLKGIRGQKKEKKK